MPSDLWCSLQGPGPGDTTWVEAHRCASNEFGSAGAAGLKGILPLTSQPLCLTQLVVHCVHAAAALFLPGFSTPAGHCTSPFKPTNPSWLTIRGRNLHDYRAGVGVCSSQVASASLTHSLSLVLVVMMKSKELKTSRSILMLILRFSLCASPQILRFWSVRLRVWP